MKAKPILMTGDVIRAIRDGNKTQMRRVCSLQCPRTASRRGAMWTREQQLDRCPFGQPDDLLWVRETFKIGTPDDCACYEPCGRCVVGNLMYCADFAGDGGEWGPWKPSIHMPRGASRLTLQLNQVRVERLQEISEQDVLREGIAPYKGGWTNGVMGPFSHPMLAFSDLWDDINPKHPYDSNPWVWAITFEPTWKNVDEVLREAGDETVG